MDAAGPPESEDAEPMPPPEDHDYAGGGDLEQLLAARKRKLEERDAMRARVAQEMAVTMDVGIRLNPTLTPRVEPLHNPSDTPLVGGHDFGNGHGYVSPCSDESCDPCIELQTRELL